MIDEIRKLMKKEAALRAELRGVSEKLAAIRAALGMGAVETPDYLDSESSAPYVSIGSLVVGAVNAAGGPIGVSEVRARVSAVRDLDAAQAGQALYTAARISGLIKKVGYGVYAPLSWSGPLESQR